MDRVIREIQTIWPGLNGVARKALEDALIAYEKGGPGSGHWGHGGGIGGPKNPGGSQAGGGLHRIGATSEDPYLMRQIMALHYRAGNIREMLSHYKNRGIASEGPDVTSDRMEEHFVEDYEDYTDYAGELEPTAIMELHEDVWEDIAWRARVEQDVVGAVADNWGETSGDHNRAALDLQVAAAEEFSIPVSKFTEQSVKEVEFRRQSLLPPSLRDASLGEQDWNLISRGESVLVSEATMEENRFILRAVHDKTQQDLVFYGFKPGNRVRLRRGVRLPSGMLPPDLQAGDTISVAGNSLESWTIDYRVATQFSFAPPEGETGLVLEMDVPVEQIVGTGRTGLGYFNEREVVIMGSLPGTHAQVLAIDRGGVVQTIIEDEKGGPGSGWFGPPRGTHGKGSLSEVRGTPTNWSEPSLEDDPRMEGWFDEDTPVGGWRNRSLLTDAEMRKEIRSSFEEETGLEKDVTGYIMGSWSQSSAGEHDSLQLQKAVADEFQLPMSDFIQDRVEAMEESQEQVILAYMRNAKVSREKAEQEILERRGRQVGKRPFPYATLKDDKVFLRETYKRTQGELYSRGFRKGDTVRLYRGVSLPEEVYQEVWPGDSIGVMGNPLESWTIGYSVGKDFADRPYGAILSMDVPIEMVFGTPKTGLGEWGEGEVVVLGSTPGSRARIIYKK